jgi:hypothetical membrane protein
VSASWRAVPVVAGVGGSAVLSASAVATAFAYRGTQGEPYSPFSHWISELGEEGVSELAPVFNGGVVVGGVCFGAVMASLAAARGGPLAIASGVIGVAAGIAGALVGVFPMNRVVAHGITSTSFFNLAAVAIALAAADVAIRPDGRFRRRLAAVGVVAAGVTTSFVVATSSAVQTQGLEVLEPPADRSAVSALTSLEWAALVLIVAWVLATSAAWRDAR